METLSAKHMISATRTVFPVGYSANPVHPRIFRSQFRRFLLRCSKEWDVYDFQGYAKPSRLLPAREIEICDDSSLQRALSLFKTRSSHSLYKVKFETSKINRSGLTDMNSGVLLCLVDENGYSILQRIPALMAKDHLQAEEESISGSSLFQQGSVDEFIFEGPSLGKVVAVWIGVESGQWRLGGVSLTVICQNQLPATNAETDYQFISFRYDFQVDDLLLGEGTDAPMVELRPSSISEFSGEAKTLRNESSYSSSLETFVAANEDSMKNYVDLKFSLLLYDAVLILAGSSIASFTAGENSGYAFVVGGLGGFLYLLLLQRSVDQIPSAELISSRGAGSVFGNLKGSISTLVLAFGVALVAAKYASGAGDRLLTPPQLLAGMAGFLMSKVAVLLAAFKPIPWYLRDNK